MTQKQLDLKKEYQENEILMKEYESKDLDTYPGWSFLLSNVIEVYGICPYLNVNIPDFKNRRMKWLKDTFDKGKIYYESLSSINSKDKQGKINNDLDILKKQLKNLVLQSIKDYNNTIPEEELHYDSLVQSIRNRVESNKGLSRKSKEEWIQTCNLIDAFSKVANYDFLKYTKIMYDIYVRHKTSSKEDSDIAKILDKCSKLNTKYILECDDSSSKKYNAQERLSSLIKDGFQINQIGKYFKRWSHLSQEKKNERIESYLNWYIRDNKLNMDLFDTLYTFILKKLASKELKTTDITWSGKFGIITKINILVKDNEIIIPKRIVITKKTSSAQNSSIPEHVEKKIHRIILYEILKYNTPCKITILNNVVKNIQLQSVKKEVIFKYTSTKYDEILNVILQNPVLLPVIL